MRYRLIVENKGLPLGIISIGCAASPTVTSFGPAHRDCFIIHYVVRGKGIFNGNPVGAGEGFVLYPGDYQYYYADPDDPWAFVWIISQEKPEFESILRYCDADSDTQIFSYSFVHEARALYDYIKSNSGTIIGPFEAMELVGKLMKHHDGTVHRQKGSYTGKDYAIIAKDHLRINYASGVTVNELTQMLGISQPYLYKVFCSEVGMSPKKYLTELRLSQAKSLLLQTQMTVSEVGLAVGFDDVLTFSKFFSKHIGMSPTHYRANTKENMI